MSDFHLLSHNNNYENMTFLSLEVPGYFIPHTSSKHNFTADTYFMYNNPSLFTITMESSRLNTKICLLEDMFVTAKSK